MAVEMAVEVVDKEREAALETAMATANTVGSRKEAWALQPGLPHHLGLGH